MAKYGRSKYGRSKYGRYEIDIPAGVLPLEQLTRYRIRTVNSLKQVSRPVVNTSASFETTEPVKVRLRSNNSDWVYQQTESIPGEQIRIRIRSVSSEGIVSGWVESIVGTIREVK